MIDIKIIQHQGHSALVEWMEDKKVKRATVPANVIKEEQVSKYQLDLGIPYGIPWSQIKLRASASKLEEELHRVGIWTAEDALNNAPAIVGALQATYSVDMGIIMKIAKQERSK
jgi:hypothetical protein